MRQNPTLIFQSRLHRAEAYGRLARSVCDIIGESEQNEKSEFAEENVL